MFLSLVHNTKLDKNCEIDDYRGDVSPTGLSKISTSLTKALGFKDNLKDAIIIVTNSLHLIIKSLWYSGRVFRYFYRIY